MITKLLAVALWLLLAHAAFAGECAPPLAGLTAPRHAAHVTDVCHRGYEALVDDDAKVPLVVQYELTGPHTIGCLKRKNNFHVDAALPGGSAASSDYAKAGFDKGHQAPAEDFAWSAVELSDSFSFANMAPQKPGLNRQQWERLEETVRAWALQYKSLSVYVGPVLDGHKTIGKHKVAVPTGFWKVIVRPDGATLAFYMDNKTIAKGDLHPQQTSTMDVAARAGVKFPFASTGTKPALWAADLPAWRKAHKKACSK